MFLKFPVVVLRLIMREKIVHHAVEMFLNYGFKSVTMDDIANALGISKKTIYQHFDNKTKLVEATVMHVFEIISEGIDAICALGKNPIEEVYEIKRPNLNVEFISRIYFNSMVAIKDKDLFPLQYFSMNEIMEYFIEYHLRGICTSRGRVTLNQFINDQS